MVEFHDPQKKAMERRYNLRCKVLVKDCSYEDEQSTGNTQTTEKLVFLIPEDNEQRTLFYMTWLPDMADECQELGASMGHPMYSTFRLALWRATPFVREIHLFVMSKGAEEILKRLDNQVVNVEILGQSEDDLLDGQTDYDLVLNKNKYDKITDSLGSEE